MNKFYKYAAMAGTFVIGLTSCSDSFLDVESVTESNTDTFYKTETDANRALIGCYDGYRQTHSAMDIGFYCLSEVMSMECFGGTGIGDDRKYQRTIGNVTIKLSIVITNLSLVKSRYSGTRQIANVELTWVRCVVFVV